MSDFKADVNTQIFEGITLFGQPMIFTCLRCDRETLPKGMYMYEIRHDDYGRGDPCEISSHIMVNHWGTVISNRPVNLTDGDNKPYRLIDSENDWNCLGTRQTLKEYMQKHPPIKEKSIER